MSPHTGKKESETEKQSEIQFLHRRTIYNTTLVNIINPSNLFLKSKRTYASKTCDLLSTRDTLAHTSAHISMQNGHWGFEVAQ